MSIFNYKINVLAMKHPKSIIIHLLLALGTAFCFTIFGIIFLECLYFSPSLDTTYYVVSMSFVLGFFYYFIYLFLKNIQKLPWLFGSTLFFILIVIVMNANIDIYVSNLFQGKSIVPREYSEYQYLQNRNSLLFKNKKIAPVFSVCRRPLQQYITTKNNLIVQATKCELTNSEEEIGLIFYKFDYQGNIMDTYEPLGSRNSEPSTDEVFFEDNLFNFEKNYYKIWPLDGDTLEISIKTFNDKLDFDEKKQNDFIKHIQDKAKITFTKDFIIPMEWYYIKFRKVFFLENNKWNVFYDNRAETLQSFNYADMTSTEKIKILHNSPENIQKKYIQKVALSRYRQGYGEEKHWEIFLYTDIIIGNDTLKIKESAIFDYDGNNKNIVLNAKIDKDSVSNPYNSFSDFTFYSNPKVDYQLFSNKPYYNFYLIKN